jgi:hypothetical protein
VDSRPDPMTTTGLLTEELQRGFVVLRSVVLSRHVRDHESQLGQKCRRTRVVRQRREGAQHVFLAYGEAGADRVRIDAHALEFLEQMCEAFRL